jgi:hypothetical protein
MQSSFLRKEISRPEMFGLSTGSAAGLLAAKRAQFNAAPLETERLHEALTMLSGPGGTVVVLNGPDGKNHRRHFRSTGLAEAQEGSRGPGPRAGEMGH